MTNPFSKDYVSKIAIDHRDRKYKRPVLNQPPVNARAVLEHRSQDITQGDISGKIRRTEI